MSTAVAPAFAGSKLAEKSAQHTAPKLGPVAAAQASGFAKIAKSGKPELLKVREVFVFKKLQTRTDTDSGSIVDEGRAQMFAAAMEKGEKFPEIKVMRVMDAPGHKDEEVDVCWDGMHTLRGKEIAKKPEVDALVWVGTWAQAQYLSATRANREHDKNGKPLSTRDKVHAVSILAAAYKDFPKSEWPSNRDLADLCGCSRQLVNDMDPFDRRAGGGGDQRETKAAGKRAERAAAAATNGKPADPSKGVKAPPHFEVIQKTTGQKVASYDAKDEAEALEIHKGHHKDAEMGQYLARKAAEPPKVGSEKPVGFDWAGMESHLSYLARGLEGMGDIFSCKDAQEYKDARAHLNSFAGAFNGLRKKHAKQKASA